MALESVRKSVIILRRAIMPGPPGLKLIGTGLAFGETERPRALLPLPCIGGQLREQHIPICPIWRTTHHFTWISLSFQLSAFQKSFKWSWIIRHPNVISLLNQTWFDTCYSTHVSVHTVYRTNPIQGLYALILNNISPYTVCMCVCVCLMWQRCPLSIMTQWRDSCSSNADTLYCIKHHHQKPLCAAHLEAVCKRAPPWGRVQRSADLRPCAEERPLKAVCRRAPPWGRVQEKVFQLSSLFYV